MFRRLCIPLLPLAFALISVGCSGGDTDPSGDPAPGAPGSSSGVGASSGATSSSGAGGAEACDGPEATDLLSDSAWLQNLQAPTEDLLVFVAKDALGGRARIESVRIDGSARTTLFSDSAELQLYSVHASAEGIFFVVRTNDPVQKYTLSFLPLSGGAPMLLASEMTGASVLGVDAEYIYLRQDLQTVEHFRRLPRTGGALEDLFDLTVSSLSPRLQQGSLFFRATPPGGSPLNLRTYRASLSSPGAPSFVFAGSEDPAPFPLNMAGFFVTPTRVVGGHLRLVSTGLDGSDLRELAVGNLAEGYGNVVVGTRGEELVVLHPRTDERLGWMDTMSSLGEGRKNLVCAVGSISFGATPGFSFADATEYEVAETTRDVFWIENVDREYKLRRASTR